MSGLLTKKEKQAIRGLLNKSPMDRLLDPGYGYATHRPVSDYEWYMSKLREPEPITGIRPGDFIPGVSGEMAIQDWKQAQSPLEKLFAGVGVAAEALPPGVGDVVAYGSKSLGGLLPGLLGSLKFNKRGFLTSRKTDVDSILSANRVGLNEVADDFTSWRTPVLQRAYELGKKGDNLAEQPIVKGWRRGKAPEFGVSQNYSDDVSERGLSLMAIGDNAPGFSDMFMGDRNAVDYEGILLPYKGSDEEPLILPFGFDNFDTEEILF